MDAVYLRPLQEEDAKVSYVWRNNPRIWEKTGSRPDQEVTYEMELAWIQKAIADKDSLRYAICRVGTDEYLGNIYLVRVDWKDKVGEEGIFIGDTSSWGKGVGTEARLQLHKIVLAQYGIEKIFSRIRKDNIGSIRSAVKSGFSQRGIDGDWILLEKNLI